MKNQSQAPKSSSKTAATSQAGTARHSGQLQVRTEDGSPVVKAHLPSLADLQKLQVLADNSGILIERLAGAAIHKGLQDDDVLFEPDLAIKLPPKDQFPNKDLPQLRSRSIDLFIQRLAELEDQKSRFGFIADSVVALMDRWADKGMPSPEHLGQISKGLLLLSDALSQSLFEIHDDLHNCFRCEFRPALEALIARKGAA